MAGIVNGATRAKHLVVTETKDGMNIPETNENGLEGKRTDQVKVPPLQLNTNSAACDEY